MQFKSLTSFFQHLEIDISSISAEHVGRIRKLVNAEFALAENGIIEIGNVFFSKQDLLDALDSKDFLTLLTAHQQISEHPGFAAFLVDGSFHPSIQSDVSELKENAKVVEITSGIIAGWFNKNQRKLLASDEFGQATEQLHLLPMILAQDVSVATEAIRNFFEEGIYLFKNTNKVTHFEKLEEINRWTLDWSSWANSVPDLFLDLKNELVLKLINYTVEIEKADNKTTYLLSLRLVQLGFVGKADRNLILSNHIIYEENVAKLKILPKYIQRKYRKNWLGAASWLSIIVIIAVLRFATGPNEVRKKNYSPKQEKTTNMAQKDAELYLRMQGADLFRQFTNFEKDSTGLQLSNKANFISYVYADSAMGGINILNNTEKSFVLSVTSNDGLFDFVVEAGKTLDFDYGQGESINFLLLTDVSMEGKPLEKTQVVGGKWIAYRERGKHVGVANLKGLDSNSVLNILNPKPPKSPLRLTIIRRGTTYYLLHDDRVDVSTKLLED